MTSLSPDRSSWVRARKKYVFPPAPSKIADSLGVPPFQFFQRRFPIRYWTPKRLALGASSDTGSDNHTTHTHTAFGEHNGEKRPWL